MTVSDPRIIDLTKRVLRLTTNSGITIAQCSEVHISCLVSLALEACGKDIPKATAMLRETFDNVMANMDDVELVDTVIIGGKDVH